MIYASCLSAAILYALAYALFRDSLFGDVARIGRLQRVILTYMLELKP